MNETIDNTTNNNNNHNNNINSGCALFNEYLNMYNNKQKERENKKIRRSSEDFGLNDLSIHDNLFDENELLMSIRYENNNNKSLTDSSLFNNNNNETFTPNNNTNNQFILNEKDLNKPGNKVNINQNHLFDKTYSIFSNLQHSNDNLNNQNYKETAIQDKECENQTEKLTKFESDFFLDLEFTEKYPFYLKEESMEKLRLKYTDLKPRFKNDEEFNDKYNEIFVYPISNRVNEIIQSANKILETKPLEIPLPKINLENEKKQEDNDEIDKILKVMFDETHKLQKLLEKADQLYDTVNNTDIHSDTEIEESSDTYVADLNDLSKMNDETFPYNFKNRSNLNDNTRPMQRMENLTYKTDVPNTQEVKKKDNDKEQVEKNQEKKNFLGNTYIHPDDQIKQNISKPLSNLNKNSYGRQVDNIADMNKKEKMEDSLFSRYQQEKSDMEPNLKQYASKIDLDESKKVKHDNPLYSTSQIFSEAKEESIIIKKKTITCSVNDKQCEYFSFRNYSNEKVLIQATLVIARSVQNMKNDIFDITPDLLEIGPSQVGRFLITVHSKNDGIFTYFLHFRNLLNQINSNNPSYTLLLEAKINKKKSVEENINYEQNEPKVVQLPTSPNMNQKDPSKTNNFDQSDKNHSLSDLEDLVQIFPSYLHFKYQIDKEYDEKSKSWTNYQNNPIPSSAQIIQLSNHNLDQRNHLLMTNIVNTHHHLKIFMEKKSISAGRKTKLYVWPIAQPVRWKNKTLNNSDNNEWCGQFTIECEFKENNDNNTSSSLIYRRDISILMTDELIRHLPSLREVARLHHSQCLASHALTIKNPSESIIPYQAEAYYYTKAKKRKESVYFDVKQVLFGKNKLGEKHIVKVKLCNGMKESITLFIQKPQRPFHINIKKMKYSVILQAKSYVEIPLAFIPEIKGKVATKLQAYSTDHIATVILMGTGVE